MTVLPTHVVAGQGPDAVLLLHGIGGGLALWGDEGSATLQALATSGVRAVALDLPGYGGSAAQGPPTLADMVDAVVAVARLMGARRLALVGHSMGGMVAQELMAQAPERVAALVLMATSPAFGRPGGAWQQQFLAQRLAPLDAGLGMARLAPGLVAGMAAPGAPHDAVARAALLMASVPEATYRVALAAIAGFDRRALLADLRLPVLCLAGEHDRNAPPGVMEQMAARIAGAQYLCIPGLGHLAHMESPLAVNSALVEFLLRRYE